MPTDTARNGVPSAPSGRSDRASARGQTDVRQGRRRDAVRAVAGDRPEARRPRLPVLPGGLDVLMAATDEVPPHDQLLRERRPSEEHEAGTGRAPELEAIAPGRQVEQRAGAEFDAADLEYPVDHEDAVLEGRIHRHLDDGVGLKCHVGTEQGRMDGRGRRHPAQGADEDGRLQARSAVDGQVRVLLERRRHRGGGLRQRHPQLEAVHGGRLLAHRELGVRHAPTARHEVELARADDHVAAHAVAVADVADERPGHGLQAGVRMRQDAHQRPVLVEAVEEAPGADHRQLALREGAMDAQAADAAEGDLAGLEESRSGSVGCVADAGDRVGVESRHERLLITDNATPARPDLGPHRRG
ncbi:hypothetical protein PLANTIT3_60129 [Plantibacter sp. T3]|nr:hypothetical protein PLANTIT3_60129 [Plantibacter sp. T3]